MHPRAPRVLLLASGTDEPTSARDVSGGTGCARLDARAVTAARYAIREGIGNRLGVRRAAGGRTLSWRSPRCDEMGDVPPVFVQCLAGARRDAAWNTKVEI